MTERVEPKSSATLERILTREQSRLAVARLIDQAMHRIDLRGAVLDGLIFNTNEVARALSGFVARHHTNRAYFLVEEGMQVLRDNPRLISLCRRFSDALWLRQVAEHDRGSRELVLIADQRSFFRQEDLDKLNAELHLNSPYAAQTLARHVQASWDRSDPVVGLHPLGL